MTPIHTLDSTEDVPNGWGGNRPLPVMKYMVGSHALIATAWVPTKSERDLLARNEYSLLNLIVATAPDGSVSYSMKVVDPTVVKDEQIQ